MIRKILLILAAVSLTLALSGCGNAELDAENEALKMELSALMEENARLKDEITALEQQLAQWNQESGLASYGAAYNAWESSEGASITITATPAEYTQGQRADLVIWLKGEEIEKLPFQWDGSCYTTTVVLPAADGYTFLCVLTDANGKETEIVLDGPEMDALVYLESNLTAFPNILVNDWTITDGTLNIHSGYAQIQLPRLVSVSIDQVRLVLTLDSQPVESQELTLTPAADEGSYETLLEGLHFALPELAEENQLDLWMEVRLSDGRELSVIGGSWFYTDGELLMAVG